MLIRASVIAAIFAATFLPTTAHATAQSNSSSDNYAAFAASATAQPGLFTIWRKNGSVYLDLKTDQLDTDFLESIVPGNGMGGNFIVWGNTDHLPAMLTRFERAGNGIAIVWPNSSFIAPGSDPGTLAVRSNFPQSVVGVGKIVAEGDGHIVFDASPLFKDTLDLEQIINGSLHTTPQTAYHLDPERTYFGATKAFPENVVIHVNQLWATSAPHVAPDTAPDARSVQMDVVYNFAQLPSDSYTPRYADDRIGLYDDIYLDFSPNRDEAPDRYLRYLVRWNFAPANPNVPSDATHPMVFYMSNTVPVRFRKAIADAVLRWNGALARVGILNAIQVRPQPNEPNWDPDDIRYNVLRWVTEESPSFGADSQTLFDPRTGEEFRTGILISAVSAQSAANAWRYIIDPVRYGRYTDPVPQQLVYDHFQSEIMHETGHNLGMQHNFIGHDAYTAAQLQNPAFTAKYGIATTVMEYAPLNIWPRPYGQGSYYQTVLGPYDYFEMKYAYQPIPGATTPDAELPVLRTWASQWSNPLYRYASDEDVAWGNGHAVDPRVETGELTTDQLGWTQIQLGMNRRLMDGAAKSLPYAGSAYEQATDVFTNAFYRYLTLVSKTAHYVGGQYLSRAHRGDLGASAPIVPVPLATQRRALALLDNYLFSDRYLTFSPGLLDKLGYSEWAGYGYVGWEGYGNLPVWAYDPPERHDFPAIANIAAAQRRTIDFLFMPQTLARLEQNPLESTGPTLTMGDLFAWMQQSIYRELANPSTHGISLLRRNLQSIYEEKLIALAGTPQPGAPEGARELARLELRRLGAAARAKLRSGELDDLTRAHVAALADRAASALKP
ncbi:MAG TPA: zinc-dependent metalloprotease [Candidatus Baltobacteraceae bacterium]|nr:zinc-dependent metalloprotease [Candidatus Baltobacteraceae bacterium]